MKEMLERSLPYLISFFSAFVLTLVLTPLVREMNRRFGMVDHPEARRINRVPIPRGGGLALVIGLILSCVLQEVCFGESVLLAGGADRSVRCTVLAAAIAALGYVDDRFSLQPKVKLAGQMLVAVLTWLWGGLGFSDIWPSLPAWADCVLTTFWILGAVNAFNLIDGLDGLATGLAFIATVGMAGALFCTGHAGNTLFYFAFGGGLLGFLRYNYNPASVFLGDCGSMFIGYILAVLPLCSHVPDSFLVSVGVPLLAMGVPIFDTALAIFRRSIRRLISRGSAGDRGRVMSADVDHLHHRILRSVGLNQRKAAWSLYAFAALLVVIGLVGLVMESRSAGLWIVAVVLVSVIVFRDMARIELYDTGCLLDTIAHAKEARSRRRWARVAVPLYVVCDLLILGAVFFGVTTVLGKPLFVRRVLLVALPVRVVSIFFFLTVFGIYRTVWSRAMLSNHLRLLAACLLGSLFGTVCIYYLPDLSNAKLLTGTILYALLPFVLLSGIRTLRSIVRDVFYHISSQRLRGRKDVERILVYGTGLRYRAFRRELVRQATNSRRVIVGLIDDDLLLRHHYIGGMRVLGSLEQAPEIVNELNVDTIVVACEVTDEWKKVVRKMLENTGVKLKHFGFSESEL